MKTMIHRDIDQVELADTINHVLATNPELKQFCDLILDRSCEFENGKLNLKKVAVGMGKSYGELKTILKKVKEKNEK